MKLEGVNGRPGRAAGVCVLVKQPALVWWRRGLLPVLRPSPAEAGRCPLRPVPSDAIHAPWRWRGPAPHTWTVTGHEDEPAGDWAPEVAEIGRRRELAQAMGGPEKVARQRAAGRL